jgi:iron complex outermembrane receptor protein
MQLSREGRVRRFSIAISVLALLSCALPAQQARQTTISGRVLDPSGAAVPAATVHIYSRDNAVRLVAQSGDDGRYRFERVPAGEYLIEARTEGLDQANPVVVQLAAGQALEKDLTLDIRGLSARVLVTASSTPQSTIESGKAMDVVDRADLDRRAVYSFGDALETTAGLRVQQLGGPGQFTRIQTRGLRAQDTSVLLDGMRLRDVASPQGDSTAFMSNLLLTGADRIEVLRGTGSSLYGTNAIGGVLNVVSDQGGTPFHGEVGGEGGGLGFGFGDVRVAGGLNHDQLQYSLSASHLNVSGGTGGIENVRNTSEQGSLLYRPDSRTTLSARLFASEGMTGVNASPYAAPDANLPATGIVPAIALSASQIALGDAGLPFSWGNATFAPNFSDPDNRADLGLTSTMLSAQRIVTPNLTLHLSWQDLLGDRNNTNGPAGAGYQPFGSNTLDYYRGRVDTLNARADLALGRHNLITGGYEFERESYFSRNTDSNSDPAQHANAIVGVTQNSQSVFAQDQIRMFSDRLLLSLSGRIGLYDLSAPAFEGGTGVFENAPLTSPRNSYTGDAALSYFFPRSQTKLRAHAGNGYRSPSLYERFGAYYYGGSFTPIGDPQLAPERTLAFDFGFDQYFASNRLKVSASYFYTRLQNVVSYGDTPNDIYGRYGGYINAGGGLARGVEVSGEARPWRSMLIQASYVYTNAIERNAVLTGGFLQAIRVFPNVGTLVASQQVGKRIQVTATFVAASDYVSGVFYVYSAGGNRPYLFAGPRKLDLTSSYTLPVGEHRSLKFYARVQNALNQTYYEDGFRTPQAWASAGVKFLF